MHTYIHTYPRLTGERGSAPNRAGSARADRRLAAPLAGVLLLLVTVSMCYSTGCLLVSY